MARGSVFIAPGQFVKGADQLVARLNAIPAEVQAKVATALEAGADELVAKAQSICPVGVDLEKTPGDLKRSIHKEAGRHALSVKIVADATDDKGAFYAAHVEYGHRSKDGSHVPEEPFFWPSYRVMKKRLKAKISRAITAAVKGRGTT